MLWQDARALLLRCSRELRTPLSQVVESTASSSGQQATQSQCKALHSYHHTAASTFSCAGYLIQQRSSCNAARHLQHRWEAASREKHMLCSSLDRGTCKHAAWHLHFRPASTKTAGSSVRDRASRNTLGNAAQSSKKERHSDLVHPLFSKKKGKSTDKGASRDSSPPLSAQETGSKSGKAGQQPGKPVSKKPPRDLQAPKAPSIGAPEAPAASKKAKQGATSTIEASTTEEAQDARVSSNYSKLSSQRGPREQVGFAPTAAKMRAAPISPDAIADPYRGVLPGIPWLDYLSLKGWSERRQRILHGARSLYATAIIRRKLGLKAADFKEAAIELFYRVNMALSKSDLTSLRQLTAPQEMSRMKNQMKLREKLDWRQMNWSVARELQPRDVEIVQARVIAIQPDHDAFTFAQLTVKISAEIKFMAFNSEGKMVKGDRNKPVKTTDYWILERSFTNAPTAKWRLASQLSDVQESNRTSLFRRLFQ